MKHLILTLYFIKSSTIFCWAQPLFIPEKFTTSDSILIIPLNNPIQFQYVQTPLIISLFGQFDSVNFELTKEHPIEEIVFKIEEEYTLEVFNLLDNSQKTYLVKALEELIGFNFEDKDVISDQGIIENAHVKFQKIGDVSNLSFPTGGANGTRSSISTNKWSTPQNAWRMVFSTRGYQNIRLQSFQKSSDSGPQKFKIESRNFVDSFIYSIPVNITCLNDGFISGVVKGVQLPASLNNKDSIELLWKVNGNTSVSGGTISSAGTSRIDQVMVYGQSIAPKAHIKIIGNTTHLIKQQDTSIIIFLYRQGGMMDTVETMLELKSGDTSGMGIEGLNKPLRWKPGDSVQKVEIVLIKKKEKQFGESIKLQLTSLNKQAIIGFKSDIELFILPSEETLIVRFERDSVNLIEKDTTLEIPVFIEIPSYISDSLIVNIQTKYSSSNDNDYEILGEKTFKTPAQSGIYKVYLRIKNNDRMDGARNLILYFKVDSVQDSCKIWIIDDDRKNNLNKTIANQIQITKNGDQIRISYPSNMAGEWLDVYDLLGRLEKRIMLDSTGVIEFSDVGVDFKVIRINQFVKKIY